MDYKTWKINGFSLELDLEDIENMERYENAFEIMKEEEKSIPEDGKASKRIRAYCEMFWHLYDNIFGDGTSERIFSGIKMHTGIYLDIYEDFLKFVQMQKVRIAQDRAERIFKYLPKNDESVS